MSSKFLQMIEEASANKQVFDRSVKNVQRTLDKTVEEASMDAAPETMNIARMAKPVEATGWLRGALSYPWAIVFILTPALLDLLV